MNFKVYCDAISCKMLLIPPFIQKKYFPQHCLLKYHDCPSFISEIKSHIRTNSKNSVALVRERTIPTERPPPVGEVSANFCG